MRPEDFDDAPGAPAGRRLSVTVDIKEDMGSEVFVHFAVDAPVVRAEELREVLGEEALAAADEQTHHHGTSFVARLPRSTTAAEGSRIELALKPEGLHFFDLDTGEAIRAVDDRAPAAVA
jgi:multiple sugar transport system ATP-binding protein